MIEVCNECVSQIMIDGELACGKAKYSRPTPSAAVVKVGAVCLHDPDLGNNFQMKKESKEAISG